MFGAIVTAAMLALYSIVAVSAPDAGTVTLPESIHAASVALSPTEGSPGWDCRANGNQVCGPANGQYAPGIYRSGVLLEPGPVLTQVWDAGMSAPGYSDYETQRRTSEAE